MSTMTRRMSVMSGHESLDTGVTNRMSGCRTAFTKFDMGGGGVSTMHFGDDSMAWIEGHVIVMFVCRNN
jgi:hypothetical protein